MSDPSRLVPALLTLCVAAAGVVRFALVGQGELGFLRLTPPDDAWYYLEIARNVAAGLGSTFDGIHPTNGYHPLWLVLLVPVALVFDDPDRFLYAAGVLFGLLWAGTGVGLAALVARGGARWLAPAAAAMWIFAVPVELFMLLESAASALFLAISGLALASVARAEHAEGAGGGRRDEALLVGAGIAVGLAVLARLDNVLLAPIAVAVAALARRGGIVARMRRATLLGLALSATLAPYLTWNQFHFGGPMPVSGATKRQAARFEIEQRGGFGAPAHLELAAGLARESLDQALLPVSRTLRAVGAGGPGARLAAAVLALVGALAWLVPLADRPRRRSAEALGALLALALAHLGFYTVGYYTHPTVWYWVPEAVAVPLVVVATLDRLGVASRVALERVADGRAGRVAAGTGVVLVLLAFAAPPRETMAIELRRLGRPERAPEITSRIDAARWLASEIPAGARGAGWNAGFIGYFFPGPFVNLDGLVNEPGFHDHVREVGVPAYLEEQRVEWVIDFSFKLPEAEPVFAALEPVAELPFVNDAIVVYRRDPASRRPGADGLSPVPPAASGLGEAAGGGIEDQGDRVERAPRKP